MQNAFKAALKAGRPPRITPALAALSEMVSKTLRGRWVSGSMLWQRASISSSAGIT